MNRMQGFGKFHKYSSDNTTTVSNNTIYRLPFSGFNPNFQPIITLTGNKTFDVTSSSRRHIQSLSDHELVVMCGTKGDEQAIGELFNRYLHLVYGVCLKYLHDRETSKDAVMQIFESLTEKMSRQEIREFKPWLYVVAKNFCLMYLRSEKMKGEKNKTFVLEQTLIMENEEILHPVDEESSRTDADLNDCIERLGNEQKECIQLFYYKNKCYRDIASVLKMDEKKVKSHLQNGKRNLKNCIEQKIHVRQKEI